MCLRWTNPPADSLSGVCSTSVLCVAPAPAPESCRAKVLSEVSGQPTLLQMPLQRATCICSSLVLLVALLSIYSGCWPQYIKGWEGVVLQPPFPADNLGAVQQPPITQWLPLEGGGHVNLPQMNLVKNWPGPVAEQEECATSSWATHDCSHPLRLWPFWLLQCPPWLPPPHSSKVWLTDLAAAVDPAVSASSLAASSSA